MSAYFPVGFPPLGLCPNLLDHLTGFPFAVLLPFPLGDNLWWILVLAANGVAGHHLGRSLGGTRGAGFLTGVAFATSEAILREANLHHAPQALACFSPLYLAALLRFLEHERRRDALAAGLFFGLASLSYWYEGFFLVLGSLLLVAIKWRTLPRFLPAIGVALLLVMPSLLPLLVGWERQPITSISAPAPLNLDIPALQALEPSERFLALHGTDLLFPFRATPLDRSNRLPLLLIAAAVLGFRRHSSWTRWGLVFMVGVSSLFLLGPVLKLGEVPLLVGGRPVPLPFAFLRELHPFLARLYWPERFGLLLVLGLVALASRAPRPGLFALGILLESFLVSGNAPLTHQDLRALEPWRELAGARGAVLELPLRRDGLDAALSGLHQRYHGLPMVNPMLLPPGHGADPSWIRWSLEEPWMAFLQEMENGRWPDEPPASALESLRSAGVAVIAVDVEPGGPLTEGAQARYRALLGRSLGAPRDLGVAWVWWLDPGGGGPEGLPDGDAWRAEIRAWRQASVRPEPDTLIRSASALKGGRKANGQ